MAQSRIGIMGGSFNPIHCRHLQIASRAFEELKLDRILFIPNGNPPHKQQELADAKHRYEMTRLAVIQYTNCTVSDIEITRDGVIYTVDTLKLLHQQYPNTEFIYLIGEDTLFELEHWKKPDQVFSLCSFAVCPRSRHQVENHPIVSALRQKGATLRFLSLEPQEISASDIRRRIAADETNQLPVPPEVSEYIRIAGLYNSTPFWEDTERMYAILKADLSADRLVHSLSVALTARHLAQLHGLNADACELAGLLHDCAKCMELKTLQQIACDHSLALSETEMSTNALLHGPVGAVLADTKYGVRQPDILSAIYMHTTGRAGMSAFDMVIFLADKIEPYRSEIPALREIRTLADKDLYKATYQMLLNSQSHVAKMNRPLHPDTENTIQWVRERIR